ncbi:MAG: Hsp20/alpha crystallin family protein [Candidatus Verstraetearchaeota archaeon]|nr:Hsp20/alpha crystallin family protein [Candidatus Verstraetearchaeota archaeon]
MSSRRRPFRFDPFWDLDQIDEMMERFMNEAFDQAKDREGPIFYGFSVSVGPDGKPMIQEFGNVKPGLKGPELKEEIEPLVDVVDSKDSLMVYAELPGVDKKDIQLSVTDESLTISVEREKRRYYKEVSLQTKVKPDTAKASYKNGVLEVTFEKAVKQSKKQIRVE